MDRWYVAQLKITTPWPVTMGQLEAQHFASWLPIIRSQTYERGQRVTTERQLFGNYLFVCFDIEASRWRSINGTMGVLYLLPARSEMPQALPAGFIDTLKRREVNLATVQEVTRQYARDETVRILSGAFYNRFARVLSSSRLSSRIRLEAFAGRDVVATLATRNLAPAAGIRI
jgi:transcription antitermination factor NusG